MMNCPNCNTPNTPETLYCTNCNALLPTPAEMRRQRRMKIGKAFAAVAAVVALYSGMMFLVSMFWSVRFTVSAPSGLTEAELEQLMTEALNADSEYLGIIFSGLSVLFAAVYYGIRKRSLADAANIRSAPAVKICAAFAAGLTAQLPLGVVMNLIPFPESLVENHNELMTASTAPLPVQLLYGVIMAPIIEEIFFRGIAHDRLAKTMPVPLAAAISGLVFGLIHGEVLAIIAAFVCGFFLGMLYSRYGTVLVPIAFHMGFNLLAYAAGLITSPAATYAALGVSVVVFVVSVWILFRRDAPRTE